MVEQMRDKKGKELTPYYKGAQELTYPKIDLFLHSPEIKILLWGDAVFFTQLLISNLPI